MCSEHCLFLRFADSRTLELFSLVCFAAVIQFWCLVLLRLLHCGIHFWAVLFLEKHNSDSLDIQVHIMHRNQKISSLWASNVTKMASDFFMSFTFFFELLFVHELFEFHFQKYWFSKSVAFSIKIVQ